MNLKTGQDLPLSWADRLRNHPVVRSFFMVGKDSPPTPLWQVLLLVWALAFIGVAIVHVYFNLLTWGL
mgnify:FL=1|tara:strand:+ start:962 stop:1165 length:204 start_codon:yes stop_codon:yes gene_type:complete